MYTKTKSRTAFSVFLALTMAITACAGPAAQPASEATPKLTDPVPTPTAIPFATNPQVPEPPLAFAPPSGTPEEQALALADAVGPDSPDRVAGWLSVYDALGVPVIGSDGAALGTTGDDPIGPAFWRVWHMAGMGSSAPGFSLVDLASAFNSTGNPNFNPEQGGALLLADLRNAIASEDPQVQLFGRFVAGIIRREPAGTDILDPAVTADQVLLHGDLAEMLAWVVIRGLVFHEAAMTQAGQGSAHLVAYTVAFEPPEQGSENCSEAVGDEDVTYWLSWALNKIGGGFQLPGMTSSTKGFVELVQEHLGVSPDVINKTQKMITAINLVTGILTLAMQMAALTADSVMDDVPPFERTKKDNPDGGTTTIHFALRMDLEALPDGNNLYACLASFLLNAFGVSFSFPAEGRIPGAEMTFTGGKGFGEYVLFGNYRQLRTDTDANGEVHLAMLGKAQPHNLPDDSEAYMREFSIEVAAQPEAVTGNTLANIFFGGLTFGIAPGGPGLISSAIDISKGFHWDLGEYVFNIKDWRTGYVVDGEYWGGYYITGVICEGIEKPFTLHADGSVVSTITGDYAMTPSGLTGGAWTFSGATTSNFLIHAAGTYTVQGVDEGVPRLLYEDGTWLTTVPLVGDIPLGEGGKHIDAAYKPIELLPANNECSSN